MTKCFKIPIFLVWLNYLQFCLFFSYTISDDEKVGDLCAAQCKMSNGKTIIVVSVYISPGTPIRDIHDFIHHVLLPYTEGGSKLLNKNYHEFP